MKKIMFSDKYCLTLAVLYGTKTMTRRVLKEGTPLGNWEETVKHLPYKVGDIVAIAQPYKDIIELLLSGKTQITYKSLRNCLYIGNSAFFFEFQAP